MHHCLTIDEQEKRPACPREGLWNRITSKWTIQVVATLSEAGDRALRFGKIRERLDGVSAKVLAETLTALERDGLVSRHEYPGYPSHVEYRLTSLGERLLPAMEGLMQWMTASWPEVNRARADFDESSRHALRHFRSGIDGPPDESKTVTRP